MLTMPGGIEGLFNIFEVDPDTLMIDEESYASDIAEYGLYTYEEFAETSYKRRSIRSFQRSVFESVDRQGTHHGSAYRRAYC